MAEAIMPEAPPLAGPRILRQSWIELSLLHWTVGPESVAHFFPPGTRPDTYDGLSYVGLVPFRMVDTGLPHGPVLIRSFLETNIRLYSVDRTGRRGVVFLSLDADRLDVVASARAVFGLPYRWARMRHERRNDLHTYTSSLRAAASLVSIRTGRPLEPGPLEHFLTARWGLHVARGGRTWYLPNEHPPWVLRAAELVEFRDDGLFASVGLHGLGRRPPDHVAYSDGVPAHFGLPVSAETPRRPLRR